jgi:COP9 signalosome complex subunit 5
MVPLDKLEDYGIHARKYYQLEHSFFKSQLDRSILDSLWNEYWMQTISSSPLLNVSLRPQIYVYFDYRTEN